MATTLRPRGHVVVDATGLLCPMPIVELAQAIRTVAVGEIVEIAATDFGMLEDAPAWAATAGHEIIGQLSEGERHTFWLRKLHD